MKPRLNKSTAYITDIADQPASRYILLLEGLYEDRQAFAVDGIASSLQDVRAWRGTSESNVLNTVVVFPVHAKWEMVSRDVLLTQPLRDVLQQQVRDSKAMEEYQQQLLKQEGITVETPPPVRLPELIGNYI